MWKLSAKWVPKCLNADQKRQRCQSSEQILENFRRYTNVSCRARLVTIGETWFYHCDPETKPQTMEWRHSGSPRPKIPSAKIRWKISLLEFFGFKTASSSMIIFQRAKLSTINYQAEYYSSLLVQLKDISKGKCCGKATNGVLICTIMLPLNGYLQPRRNWATWASTLLTTNPILRIWPRQTTICSLD